MPKTIKISEKNYLELNRIAGNLRVKKKKPVSVDDAIKELLSKSENSILNFAGAWSDMTDEEEENLKNSLEKMWERWKI